MKSTSFPTYVDRGWYLAVFYRENKSKLFPEILEKARILGNFANLLDENAEVVYRNIVRDTEVEAFWPVLQLLGTSALHVEFFMNGTPLSFPVVQEILLCRRKHLFEKKCPEFIVRNTKLGCGSGILFDLETTMVGRYWFDFYEWKKGHLFVQNATALSTYFQNSPRQVLCKLNRSEEISLYFHRLPLEINVLKEWGWSLTLKSKFILPWVRKLFSQEFVAIAPKLPDVNEPLFLERIQEKIKVVRLEGAVVVGTIAKESQKFFQEMKTEKILIQMVYREDYYFRFRLVSEINEVSPPKGKLSKDFVLSPCPKNTSPYQQFLTQFFSEETSS